MANTDWREGDRVLAPWEPTYLYAGTIEEVNGAKALIHFDDGDSGWVPTKYIKPLKIDVGQRVMSRRRMGPHFFPGEIREVHGEDLVVEFDDGKEESITVASLRITCAPMGQGAKQVEVHSHTAFHDRLQEGDRVWALWDETALFPGTVAEKVGGEAMIHFDDGDEAWVRLEHLMPLDLVVGMFVMCRRAKEPRLTPAMIADTEGDRVRVDYQDGKSEWTTASALVLPLQQPPTSRNAPRGNGNPRGSSNRAISSRGGARSAPLRDDGWEPNIRNGLSPALILGVIALLAGVAGLFFWLGRL